MYKIRIQSCYKNDKDAGTHPEFCKKIVGSMIANGKIIEAIPIQREGREVETLITVNGGNSGAVRTKAGVIFQSFDGTPTPAISTVASVEPYDPKGTIKVMLTRSKR